ncbi:MAG: efflux RND transporter permease subunit [Candidatus Omnitrophota bacterium]
MSLPEFSIRKRVTVVMGTVTLILLGLIAFTRLPQELFPPLVFPQITVVTEYVNAAPEEIETLITKPIEEAVSSVNGLKRLESISREGISTVVVSFNWGQDIDFAALAVREKIDLIKERLPKEAEDPVVLKYDPLTRPIMILSVTARDMEPVRLKLLTEKMLKDNLEKIEGVASATISGGLDREVLIEIDQGRLEASHLSLLDVIESVEEANVSYPAGSIKKGLYEYLIRTVGEFQSVEEIKYAVAGVDTVKDLRPRDTSFLEKDSGQGPRETLDALRREIGKEMLQKRLVLTRDIGDVIDGFAEKTSIARYNGVENISISIQKQASANSIQLVDRIKKELAVLKEDVETRGLRYEIVYDHSTFIRRSLSDLLSEAMSGGVLAFIILLLFLGSLGPSIVVTLSIPITVIGVFFLMSLFGITVNIMSLGGLALGIGMIVDTSIVVLENIFRRRQLGERPEEAAVLGGNEVIWPVISSNLTSIAVFFPLIVFVPGIPGQLFKDLSWTVIFSQVISAIIPLTLVVMLSTQIKVTNREYKPIVWTGFLEKNLLGAKSPREQNVFLVKILAGVLGIFILFLFLFPMMEREVLPKVDQGQFLVKMDMPIGTRLEVTDTTSRKIEEALKAIRDVKDVAVTVGSEKRKEGEAKVETLRASQAILLVNLDKKRKRSSAEVVQELREKIKGQDLGEADISFILQENEFAFAQGGAKPVVIEVRGYDFEVMKNVVHEVKKSLGKIHGIFGVQDDIGDPTPETKLEIDKRRAALYGISALDISLTAKAAIEGVVATQYREAGREFDIRVRLRGKDRDNIQNLNNLLIYSKVLDSLIPLKEVARVERGLGPSEIRRVNQERSTIITADISKDVRSAKVLEQVKKTLAAATIPQEFQVVLSGQAREVKENFSKVNFAFILSIMLVYMIMASQFESLMQPLIIMFTVPLAFVGVAIALWVTNTSINVISLLGIVLLGGVVVNNGIILIEYTNQLREQGLELVEAAMQAVKIRTRPILMSATTTVVGLLPLALGLGEGSELRAPLAITTMGGLMSSTLLTLFVIPSLYILSARLAERFFAFEEEPEEEEEAGT